MKTLLTIFLCLCASVASAQTWVTANQLTVGWDAVAPLQPTDTVKYQVYLRQGTSGDGTAYGAETLATQQLITFTEEGRYFIGVRAVRYPLGETVGIPSPTISWSNVAEVTQSGPFGAVYFVSPNAPVGLRRVP